MIRLAEVAELAGRRAALLHLMPTGAVVAGRTAAQLHGMWLPALPTDPIELILPAAVRRPRDLAASRRREVRVHRRELLRTEFVIHHGVPTTSEARSWCDLAETLSVPDLVAAGDWVLRGGDQGAEEIRGVCDRAAGSRGIIGARFAIRHLDGGSRSRPESHLRYALVGNGLPAPEVNRPILSDAGDWIAGDWIVGPDLQYAAARLALEYNGADHAVPRRMRRDITRELDLQLAGWRVITFGPRQILGRPDQVATFVRAVLAERDPGRLRRPRTATLHRVVN